MWRFFLVFAFVFLVFLVFPIFLLKFTLGEFGWQDPAAPEFDGKIGKTGKTRKTNEKTRTNLHMTSKI